MKIEGGCYCGNVRYQAEGDPVVKGLCCCRECQYFTGGSQNVVMGIPQGGFTYTKGSAASFTRSDLEGAVKRDFCSDCGTHFGAWPPGLPGVFMLRVGTLDDPSVYGGPHMVIFTCDKQPYHHIPEGVVTFDKVPG